ncbi:MAG: hypothetical protein ACC726_12480 [Chloroflexota bacterium]
MSRRDGGLGRRVPLLLDQARYRKVVSVARREGISVGAVIREAIDGMPPDQDRRQRAVDAILSAAPMSVPDDPADIRRELDDAHDHDAHDRRR